MNLVKQSKETGFSAPFAVKKNKQTEGLQISCPGGQPTERRSEHHTDVSDIDRDVDQSEKVPDDTGGGHEARVDGSSDHSA